MRRLEVDIDNLRRAVGQNEVKLPGTRYCTSTSQCRLGNGRQNDKLVGRTGRSSVNGAALVDNLALDIDGAIYSKSTSGNGHAKQSQWENLFHRAYPRSLIFQAALLNLTRNNQPIHQATFSSLPVADRLFPLAAAHN
ncbi:hypothetical protein D9M71_549960 [compost metagenome]